MAYIPFRDEEVEFRPNDPEFIEDLYKKKKETIRKVKSKVMEHLEDVQEARYFVEETTKKLDLTSIGISLDATTEQSNAKCQEELDEVHPDYSHLDTDNVIVEESNVKKFQNIYRKIDIPDKNTLKVNTRQLDQFQRSVIDIGVKYAKDIIKSSREGNKSPEPPYLMVHGGDRCWKVFCNKNLS